MTEVHAEQSLEGAWMASLLEKKPADTIALYNLAARSLTDGQAARGEKLSRRLLALEPQDARTLTGLGSALEAEGKDAKAEVQFRAALQADPKYTSADFHLAVIATAVPTFFPRVPGFEDKVDVLAGPVHRQCASVSQDQHRRFAARFQCFEQILFRLGKIDPGAVAALEAELTYLHLFSLKRKRTPCASGRVERRA